MSYGEEDTRAKLIDPALHKRGWSEDCIRREQTRGAIELVGKTARRRRHKRTDYVLRLKTAGGNQPVAVALVEAKKESQPPDSGLEQAKKYRPLFHVPFVFSCNGHLFVEYDHFTGKTSQAKPMKKFPKPETLRRRYEAGMNFSLGDEAAKPLLTPYRGGEGSRRYYQDAAIRAALEKIARGEKQGEAKRILLSLATGTGKTFIAVNLLKRIADAGQLKRALFLCDRNELRAQANAAFNNVFGSDAAIAERTADGANAAKNARVHIATYQTLGVDTEEGDASFLGEHYPPDHFSHIVIDECHRSAWNKWSQVLKRNPGATHIGLTATPRIVAKPIAETGSGAEARLDRDVTANNLKYFGAPVYEYGITQGTEDGYLAACVIRKGSVNLDRRKITRGEILARKPYHPVSGEPLGAEDLEEIYDRHRYETALMLPDRVRGMCADFFNALLASGGPEQKSIIFCVRDSHADAVAAQMNNLYADWRRANNRRHKDFYAFKCTAAADGNRELPDLRGASGHHFVAATVDLLSTGVDVPCVNNIAFFRYIRSPISLYQMIGRGTRIDEASGKLMFTIHDYTDATDLLGRELKTPPPRQAEPGSGGEDEAPPIAQVEGFRVYVSDIGSYVLAEENGKETRMPMDEYLRRFAQRLTEETPTLDELRRRWVAPQERRALLSRLRDGGCSAAVLQVLRQMEDYDLYDILADLGFGLSPRTRRERAGAFAYKNEPWLNNLPPQTADALCAIVGQFEKGGTDELENPKIFDTPEVAKAGGIRALQAAGEAGRLLTEAKARVFAA